MLGSHTLMLLAFLAGSLLNLIWHIPRWVFMGVAFVTSILLATFVQNEYLFPTLVVLATALTGIYLKWDKSHRAIQSLSVATLAATGTWLTLQDAFQLV